MPASELAFSGAAVSSTSSYIPPRGIHDAFDSESTSTLRQSIRGIEAQLVDLVCQSWTLEELIGWLRVPLECAAFTGNAAALKRLLAAGVTIEVPPGRRQPLTLLHLAAKSGNAGAVEKFVRAGVDVYETGSALDDGTALHCAAAARNDAVVRALARTKTDVGALNARGSSLLQYACAGESCEALLRDGDTLDWVTLEGVACSSFSASNEQAGQLLQVLTAAQEADVRTRMCIEALYYAVVANRPDTIRDFVALDADVKYRRGDWLPYLHRVTSRGLPKAIEALLQAGANVEARYNGSTYLHFACDHFHANVIQMLLYWGAEESSTDPDINTP
eukprot:jgi/Undpi1/8875/HiC_scaffold_25.g11337.m1